MWPLTDVTLSSYDPGTSVILTSLTPDTPVTTDPTDPLLTALDIIPPIHQVRDLP